MAVVAAGAVIFKRGDVCIIRNVEGVEPRLRGKECVVLTPLIRHRHEVEVDGLSLPAGLTVFANPAHLEKLPPPNLKGNWDECVWKPSVLA